MRPLLSVCLAVFAKATNGRDKLSGYDNGNMRTFCPAKDEEIEEESRHCINNQ
jgi:hypothetical protein